MRDLKTRIDEWTLPPFDKETIDEIRTLVSEDKHEELEDRFYTQLEFGTGGLRGIIGAGTNRMNIYTVGMATQGLANYLISCGGTERGAVIGRDSRIMSEEFAKESAMILAANGIKVFYFEDIIPVPFVSFAVRELEAMSGIMITASHNPPEYNGYKVYWEGGSQIVPPHDDNIINEVKKIDSIGSIKKIDFDEGIRTGLITITGDNITSAYTDYLSKAAFREVKESGIKIVYTPIHGTGYKIVPGILNHFGFVNVNVVKSQAIPDGKFPSVKSPNPEEKEALKLALELAGRVDADIIMATDPDSDRMGIGFKNIDGEYTLINGNQIGTMLEYYILKRGKLEGKLPENGAVIKTIVTTELQSDIAESFSVAIDDVLTGFKWIAHKMKEYESTGEHSFIFGGEESYGYLPVNFVRDKDAVSSCYFFAEMTDWLIGRGEKLYEFLDEIYLKYGLYLEDLHSLTIKGVEGIEKISEIMENLRNKPPLEFAGIDVEKIADFKDLNCRYTHIKKNEPLTGVPSSNVLQFFLSDGSKITMRPSGTEPKIKFYFSVKSIVDESNIEREKVNIREKMLSLKKDLLEIIN